MFKTIFERNFIYWYLLRAISWCKTNVGMFFFRGTVCEVCKRTLARRLGKQGYECRDCLLKCHKHCHVKVDTMCSTSTIQSIEL